MESLIYLSGQTVMGTHVVPWPATRGHSSQDDFMKHPYLFGNKFFHALYFSMPTFCKCNWLRPQKWAWSCFMHRDPFVQSSLSVATEWMCSYYYRCIQLFSQKWACENRDWGWKHSNWRSLFPSLFSGYLLSSHIYSLGSVPMCLETGSHKTYCSKQGSFSEWKIIWSGEKHHFHHLL